MGLLDLLFGSKNKSKAKSTDADRCSVPQTAVLYRGRSIEIESIGFSGLFAKSKSGEWILGWSDFDEVGHRGGSGESVYGDYVLYNSVRNNIVLQGKLERPNSGCVGDNGNFSIEDWHFDGGQDGTFYAFSATGNILIKKTSMKLYIIVICHIVVDMPSVKLSTTQKMKMGTVLQLLI